jgi:hypothetical protein
MKPEPCPSTRSREPFSTVKKDVLPEIFVEYPPMKREADKPNLVNVEKLHGESKAS